jgi:hypothetical protein
VIRMGVDCCVGGGWFSIYISISRFVCFRIIVKSRKFIELWVSYVGLSFMLS